MVGGAVVVVEGVSAAAGILSYERRRLSYRGERRNECRVQLGKSSEREQASGGSCRVVRAQTEMKAVL